MGADLTGTSDECVLTHSEPVRRDDQIQWTGTLQAVRTLESFMSFTWRGGRYRPSARPWLLGFLPAAMRSGRRRLVVDGTVDSGTLANLMEWQELHHRWWPDETRVLDIRVGVEPAPRVPRRSGAVTAFSGGVDSAFTLLRHRPGAPQGTYRQTQLSAALMVHGFDMSHRDDDFFPAAWERSCRMLDAHGVTPLRMQTDLRLVGQRARHLWGPIGHGPALAAVLACVEQDHHTVLIPSSYPYEHFVKWGSTPVADPLLGSHARPVWHDGAAFDKLDKVLQIAHDPAIAGHVRVCFAARQHDRNCGRCFKCLSTQACFWLAGVPAPPAFQTPATVADVAAIELTDTYKINLGRHIVAEARTRGREDIAAAFTQALRAVGEEPDDH